MKLCEHWQWTEWSDDPIKKNIDFLGGAFAQGSNRCIRWVSVLNVSANVKSDPQEQIWTNEPCKRYQCSPVYVNCASWPASQGSAGSDSYANTSTSTACSHGISIPNVFQDECECNYFCIIARSLRKVPLNKWILTRGICIQKHSGFRGSGWSTGEGLWSSLWISLFTASLNGCLSWSPSHTGR